MKILKVALLVGLSVAAYAGPNPGPTLEARVQGRNFREELEDIANTADALVPQLDIESPSFSYLVEAMRLGERSHQLSYRASQKSLAMGKSALELAKRTNSDTMHVPSMSDTRLLITAISDASENLALALDLWVEIPESGNREKVHALARVQYKAFLQSKEIADGIRLEQR
jgi:hypothetical protein